MVVGDGRGLRGVFWRRGWAGAASSGPTPLLSLFCPLHLFVQGVEAPGRGGASGCAAGARGAILRRQVCGDSGDAVPSRRAAVRGVGRGEFRRAGEVSSERRQPPTAGHPGWWEEERGKGVLGDGAYYYYYHYHEEEQEREDK